MPDLTKVSLTVEVPRQWRHLMIVSLAMLITMIGIGNQSVAGSMSGNSVLTTNQISRVQATDQLTNFLPAISSIELPPVPIRNAGAKEPAIAAAAAILIDDTSKLLLYQKVTNERRSVASTTKIITAQVALARYPDLEHRIKISKETLSQIGSGVGFRSGETATVSQLLHGLLMVSGNDAALQLAELYLPATGPTSTEAFVEEMNSFGRRLGMTNSRFYDPAGLDDHGYSTPSDMVKAMSELLKSPELVKIIGAANYEYTSPENFRHTLKNSDRLVTEEMPYPGIIGGKTGFTPETQDGGAGHCLIVAAMRNGHRLIAAVYGTYNSAPQASAEVARTLLDYGFTNFTWQPLAR